MSNIWKKYLLIILTTFLVFLSTKLLYAAGNSVIDATVRISVCGNDIKEGGEDCDNEDYGGNTCGSVGYSVGILNCINDCSYDTTLCILIPTATPTLSPTQAPSIVSTEPASVTTESSTPTPDPPEIFLSPEPESSSRSIIEEVIQKIIPQTILKYDKDGDNVISAEELIEGLQIWVESWREEREGKEDTNDCDINQDDICNFQDFSVLLYYYNKS